MTHRDRYTVRPRSSVTVYVVMLAVILGEMSTISVQSDEPALAIQPKAGSAKTKSPPKSSSNAIEVRSIRREDFEGYASSASDNWSPDSNATGWRT